MTSAPETSEAPQDPYALLARAASLATAHTEGDLDAIRGQLAAAAEHAHRREERSDRALDDFRQHLDDRLEGVRGQLTAAAEHAHANDERTGAAIADFVQQVQALELAYGRGLAQALKTLRQVAQTADSHHEEITGLFAAASAAAEAEGGKTRQQVSDVMAGVRTLMAHGRETKSSVVNLEHVITAAIGMARDQTHQRIADLHTEHTRETEAAAGRQERALEALGRLEENAAEHDAVLGKAAYDVDQLTRDIPAHVQAVMRAVKTASEEGRREGLDIEGRITQAVSVASERTEGALHQAGAVAREMSSALAVAAQERAQSKQMLASISEALGALAEEIDAVAAQSATTADLEKLRGEVSALADLLAQTTESFEQSVAGAVDTLTVLRTAWGEETRRVLVTLEEMARVFLEKANASEHTRDAAVVELGRRVARLELDRPQTALTAGS